jgi:hypothetical protein
MDCPGTTASSKPLSRAFIQLAELRKPGAWINPLPEVIAASAWWSWMADRARQYDSQIVQMLRDARGGACISRPDHAPLSLRNRHINREEMIAHGRTTEEIAAKLRDSLHYLARRV